MDAKIAPHLGTVQETLLIPLCGRAVETRDPDGLTDDPTTVIELGAGLNTLPHGLEGMGGTP